VGLSCLLVRCWEFSFFLDLAAVGIFSLSLHDALPISERVHHEPVDFGFAFEGLVALVGEGAYLVEDAPAAGASGREIVDEPHKRSEEHTSELQSRENLVCRLLLEKKKKTN